jgi:predicted RNase H-like HicB family nuclease
VKKYAVVFEKSPNNYAAYVPDLPGCVSTGATREEVERNIREAIAFHIEGLQIEGEPIPEPTSWTEVVEASVT